MIRRIQNARLHPLVAACLLVWGMALIAAVVSGGALWIIDRLTS